MCYCVVLFGVVVCCIVVFGLLGGYCGFGGSGLLWFVCVCVVFG